MARDQPAVFVLTRAHGTVRTDAAEELIIKQRHRSKAAVTLASDYGRVYYKIWGWY